MPAGPGRLRLTVLGCSNAIPYPDAAASGFLVEYAETTILLDAGQGVAIRLAHVIDPRQLAGIVIGHMHADHFFDLVGVRYLFPWAGGASSRLPVMPAWSGSRRGFMATPSISTATTPMRSA